MFGIKLNPCGITTKAAVLAITSNAIEGVKHLPGRAVNGVRTLKANKTERAMKNRMSIIAELNEVEKVIEDFNERGIDGFEVEAAVAYADVLRAKLSD